MNNLFMNERTNERQDTQYSLRNGTQLAFRDIGGATNERSGIVAMVPLVGLGHTVSILRVGASRLEMLHVPQT